MKYSFYSSEEQAERGRKKRAEKKAEKRAAKKAKQKALDDEKEAQKIFDRPRINRYVFGVFMGLNN